MRRSAAEMLGEFLRETGVLVLVFYGLAALLSGDVKGRTTAALVSSTVGLNLVVLGRCPGEEEDGVSGFYLQLGVIALAGLLVFAIGIYSIHREKKRSS